MPLPPWRDFGGFAPFPHRHKTRRETFVAKSRRGGTTKAFAPYKGFQPERGDTTMAFFDMPLDKLRKYKPPMMRSATDAATG